MAAVTELGYLGIGVSSLEAWKEFACNIAGAEWIDGPSPGTAFLRIDSWHHRFHLVEDGSDDMTFAGFRVAGTDEFHEMHKQLKDAGIEAQICAEEEAEERHVLELMKLTDTDGNPLEIFHGPHVKAESPFYPGRRMHGKFKTGTGGMGHLMLRQTGDLDKTYQFYRQLGMRGGIEYKALFEGMDRPMKFLFMHCMGGTRDHTISFGAPMDKRINHVMLEYTDLNDVGLAKQIVSASDYPVGIELGKHSNDDMYSFYVQNPSGWQLELGWAGREPLHQSEYYEDDIFGHERQAGVVAENFENL